MITQDIYGIRHVTRPGRQEGESGPIEPIHTCDPPEIMAQCMACPLADCDPNHCPIKGVWPRKRGRPSVVKPEAARRLYAQGMTDTGISRCLGISRNAVKDWRVREGLPRNRDRWSAVTAMREAWP